MSFLSTKFWKLNILSSKFWSIHYFKLHLYNLYLNCIYFNLDCIIYFPCCYVACWLETFNSRICYFDLNLITISYTSNIFIIFFAEKMFLQGNWYVRKFDTGQYKWKYNYSFQFQSPCGKRSFQMHHTRFSSCKAINPPENVAYT